MTGRWNGARDGLIITLSMVAAGGLDYAVNILAGRWLDPVGFGVFVSVTAMLQTLMLVSTAIRMVVALGMIELAGQGERVTGAFILGVLLWCGRWGLMATALAALISPVLARPLQLADAWPLWAASLMIVPLFLREASFGVLQGVQAFSRLGLVQVVQAVARLLLTFGLVLGGGGATAAILAQPMAGVVAVGLMLWWLRRYLRPVGSAPRRTVDRSLSASTVLGLVVFGLITNLDAIFVKLFYSPEAAGNYAPVVTLERISLFLPWAISYVLLPKVAQHRAAGRDPRPVLGMAMLATLAPGLAATAVCFVFPGLLVRFIFTASYADPGALLGLGSLATTLYAGLNLWLNYAISLQRTLFVAVLAAVFCVQGIGMYLLGRSDLRDMALVMVMAGLLGNLAGIATLWFAPHAGGTA